MWYKIQDQQVKLNIFVKPNAKKTAIVGVINQELHILLQAKPYQGEANKVLIAYLAKLFRVPKNQVILQRGEGSRHKLIVVPMTSMIQLFLHSFN